MGRSSSNASCGGSLDDLPAIALNNFLKSERLDGTEVKERLAANLCNKLLHVPICMRLGSLVIEETPLCADRVLQSSID